MAYHRSSYLLFFLLAFPPLPALAQTSAHPVKLNGSPTLSVTDRGSWKLIQKGAEFRKVTLERSEPYQVIELKLLRFDTRWVVPRIVRSLQYRLKVADVRTLAEKSGAIAMINGNYFDEKGRPLGFLKAASEEINARISKSSLFTGIFAVKDLQPFIVHRDHFAPQQADEGMQAGPLLLTKGSALAVTRGAGRQSRRSLIGIDREQKLIVAVTNSLFGGLNWVELQELFSSEQWEVQTLDLLNLDGGGSAQLYVRGDQLEELVAGATEVPVAIGFFPK